MTKKELNRGGVIPMTSRGELQQQDAADRLNLSVWQIKRLCKRYREEGLLGLAHKGRGKSSGKKMPEDVRKNVLELIPYSKKRVKLGITPVTATITLKLKPLF